MAGSANLATLKALSPETVQALGGLGEVAITVWPFRVGRESRTAARLERDANRRTGLARPNNDLFLHDEPYVKFVSREHFQIECHDTGTYWVRDRGSVCGLMVGDRVFGGGRNGGVCGLQPGNVILVGGPDAPYAFQFVTPGMDLE